MPGALGRLNPPDMEHVEKYPLSALPSAQQPTGVPVVLGIDWYSNFDRPQKGTDGRWWIGRGDLGSLRGGHCVCIKSVQTDPTSWWDFYDQGAEGACVGFGCSRMMSLLNRKRYYSRWLWDHAKLIDVWDDTNPGDDNGTSVRAALHILRASGHVPWKRRYQDEPYQVRDGREPVEGEGLNVYRWATSADEVLDVIQMATAHKLGSVPILNSWGRYYPHITWMPGETLQRLIDQDGEVGLVTDR